MKTNVVLINEQGAPEVLRWTETELPEPDEGEVRVRHSAIGLNYIDVYHRSGLYPVPRLPCIVGLEGAGVVEAIGAGVTEVKTGDRVAYAAPPIGAYAEARNMPADQLVILPDAVPEQQAAAMMLKGLTAQYLLRRTYRVQPGDTILVQAAAGGVGSILCQWAHHLGATVIGTVGTDEKAELARNHGCDYSVVYTRENFVERVKEITDGAGVAVVYDSVGKETFDGSLDCLRPLGMMASFGQSSGNVPPFDPAVLSAKGSLFLTRPSLMAYTAKREDLLAGAAELFDVVESGGVRITVNQTFELKEAKQAHQALEARQTTGSTVLLP